VIGDGLDEFRSRLTARVDDCWERLDDVLSELTALHGVRPDDLLAHVRLMLEREGARSESDR
jgi:hypothetical protein